MCKYHEVTNGYIEPAFGDEDYETDLLTADQKENLHMQIAPSLNRWISLLKNNSNSRIYIGASMFPGPFRALNDSHVKSKPHPINVGEICRCRSVVSMRELEYFAIKTVMEECGEKKLLNQTGGGGGLCEGELVKVYYLYCIYYENNQQAIEMSNSPKKTDLSIKFNVPVVEHYALMDREVGFLLGAPLHSNCNASTPYTIKFAKYFGYDIKPTFNLNDSDSVG